MFFTESSPRSIQSQSADVRVCVCLSMPLRNTHFRVSGRRLVEEHIPKNWPAMTHFSKKKKCILFFKRAVLNCPLPQKTLPKNQTTSGCRGDFWSQKVFIILACKDTIFQKKGALVFFPPEIVKTRQFGPLLRTIFFYQRKRNKIYIYICGPPPKKKQFFCEPQSKKN